MKHTWPQEGTIMLRDDERIDDLQRNHYGIIQRKGAFVLAWMQSFCPEFAVVKRGRCWTWEQGQASFLSFYCKDRGKPLYRSGDSGRICGYGQAQRSIQPSGG